LKKYGLLIFIITLNILLIPIAGVEIFGDKSQNITNETTEKADETDYFLVYDSNEKEVIKVSELDYVCGAVAAEMPVLFEDEALKAQAVAAYTYACREREINRKNPDPEKENADISANPAENQGFLTVEDMKKRWGENFEKYYSKLKNAVEPVLGEKILYEDELILAVYHATSSGKTESCSTVWGSDLPYLKAVDSSGDTQVENYLSTASFTPKELKEKITALWPETIFSDNPESWIKDITKTDSQTVKSCVIGSARLTGASVRHCLGLRSAAFDVEYKDGSFVFTVKGHGHGVGMSQNGANQMAKNGSNYKEILCHYYQGVTIC